MIIFMVYSEVKDDNGQVIDLKYLGHVETDDINAKVDKIWNT